MVIVAGLDPGFKTSPSVLTLADRLTGRVVLVERYNYQALGNVARKAIATLKARKVERVCVDAANAEHLIEQLRFAGIDVQPVHMTKKTRERMSAAFVQAVAGHEFIFEGKVADEDYDSLALCFLCMRSRSAELMRERLN